MTVPNVPGIGSSPPAWGTLPDRAVGVQLYRFIPTCVGNIFLFIVWTIPPTVHPHLRGEHTRGQGVCLLLTGSSPPAWGTYLRDGHLLPMIRFIPTCVGNIIDKRTFARRIPVHPHLRGEHMPTELDEVRDAGSSPPAWGT